MCNREQQKRMHWAQSDTELSKGDNQPTAKAPCLIAATPEVLSPGLLRTLNSLSGFHLS